MIVEVEKWNLLSKEDKIAYAKVLIGIDQEFIQGNESVIQEITKYSELMKKYIHIFAAVAERKERLAYYKEQLQYLEKNNYD